MSVAPDQPDYVVPTIALSTTLTPAAVVVNALATETIIDLAGTGKVEYIFFYIYADAGAIAAAAQNLIFTIDGNVWTESLNTLWIRTGAATLWVVPITWQTFDDEGDVFRFCLKRPIHFKRTFRLEWYNGNAVGNNTAVHVLYSTSMIR